MSFKLKIMKEDLFTLYTLAPSKTFEIVKECLVPLG
jgi:hypothetical protein